MQHATLAILNANVLTLNPNRPSAEALAVKGDRIVAVGGNEEVRKHINDETFVLDAKNLTVVPGLVDCHVHMMGFGRFLQSIDLRDTKSIEELKQKLAEFARQNPSKKWILGGRWDQEKFVEKRFPTRWDLDAAVKDKPVFLTRVCGHVGVANSKALELAKITSQTTVDGGKIDLDEFSSEPNGILRENALELVRKIIPKPDAKELEETCLAACQKAVEAGLTGVHWIADSMEEVFVVKKLGFEGKLPLRVYLGVPAEFLDDLINMGLLSSFKGDFVKFGFVKILADGSFGARTAALKKPYSDDPTASGMLLYSQRELNKLVFKVHKLGLQLAVHAIGDLAVEAVLKAFSRALRLLPRENHRHRIEHCSMANPKAVRLMGRLGLIASVQPHFVVSDFWIVNRVGEARARWVYPFKTLLREGVVVASGSDCPVEPINPLFGVWAAVARKSFPEESLTLEEALKTYTLNAAYASFDEDRLGSIEVGKLADLTVLSGDLSNISPESVRDVAVEMTIVGGKIVYQRQ